MADQTLQSSSPPVGRRAPQAQRALRRSVTLSLLWLGVVGLAVVFDQRLEALWDALGDDSAWASYVAVVLTGVLRPHTVALPLVLLQRLDRRLGRRFLREAAWVMLSQLLLSNVLKLGFGRLRPGAAEGATVFGGWSLAQLDYSFPSGHATGAFALAALLVAHYPRWRAAFVLPAAAIALARVQLDRHFPSDVLAGAVLGWYWAHWVLGWRRRRWTASTPGTAPVEAGSETEPPGGRNGACTDH
jgi:membrane-associated phospholipid phosphatase